MNARRRCVLCLLLAPCAALARSPGRRRRVAFIGFPSMFEESHGLDAIVNALARRGFVDGQRIDVLRVPVEVKREGAQARGLDALVPVLEPEVRRARPDVIVAVGSIMAAGLRRVTREIPMVTNVADPVAMGLAVSLARPGGNVTGVSGGLAETAVKTLELMRSLVPNLRRVAIFHDARPMATLYAGAYEKAARIVGVEPVMRASFETEGLVRALREAQALRVDAGLMAWSPPEGDEAFYREAVALRMPLAGTGEEAAERGALVSYVPHDPTPVAERMAEVVEQVLKGADPATIPFRYPQAFRLVVNKRTARSLGFAVPRELELRADRIIG